MGHTLSGPPGTAGSAAGGTHDHSHHQNRPHPVGVPSAPWLIGGVYALSVLTGVLFLSVVAALDLHPEGRAAPLRMVLDIGTFGTAALAIGVLLGRYLSQTPERCRVGAIVFGALAVISLIFFWSGARGVFGAVAAWLGGLTRGRGAHTGTVRVFAIIGLCIAVLNCVTTVAGFTVDAITRL